MANKRYDVSAIPVEDLKGVVTFDATTKEQLIELAKGAGFAAVDAALVYVQANLDRIDFGNFKSAIISVANFVIKEIRNMLHGGNIV